MLKPLIPHDPTASCFAKISQLNAGAQPNSQTGVWASRDDQRAMLLIQTRALVRIPMAKKTPSISSAKRLLPVCKNRAD